MAAFSPSPTTAALNHSSMGWFGACRCRPAPGGYTPSLDVVASVLIMTICLVAQVGEAFSAGVWALRPAVIHRKLSYRVQSQRGALCQRRLLTVTTTLKLQERNVRAFFGGGMASQQKRSARTQPAPPARLNPSRAHRTGLTPVVFRSLVCSREVNALLRC